MLPRGRINCTVLDLTSGVKVKSRSNQSHERRRMLSNNYRAYIASEVPAADDIRTRLRMTVKLNTAHERRERRLKTRSEARP